MHAVTAEAGGDAAIIEKLETHHNLFLNFPIHSDPQLKLLPSGELLVTNTVHSSRNYTESQTDEIQGAMVVVDSKGVVTNWWSWKRLKAWHDKGYATRPSEGADTTYDDPGTNETVSMASEGIESAGGPETSTSLVNVRVDPDDIVVAVKEGRPFKLKQCQSHEKTYEVFVRDEKERAKRIPGYKVYPGVGDDAA